MIEINILMQYLDQFISKTCLICKEKTKQQISKVIENSLLERMQNLTIVELDNNEIGISPNFMDNIINKKVVYLSFEKTMRQFHSEVDKHKVFFKHCIAEFGINSYLDPGYPPCLDICEICIMREIVFFIIENDNELDFDLVIH